MVNGKEVERRELDKPLTFGRGEDCDIRVSDNMLSRRHLRIESGEDGWIVIDLESKNGTMVDGKRITRQAIHDGQVVRAGGVLLRFELEARARSLEDEVLAMLNDTAPSPQSDAADSFCGKFEAQEAVPSALPSAIPAEPPTAVTPEPTVAERSRAPVPPVEPSSKGPQGARADLWSQLVQEAPKPPARGKSVRPANAPAQPAKIPAQPAKRSAAAAAAAGKPSLLDRARDQLSRFKTTGVNSDDDDRPWYRRRIPMPVAIGIALIVAVCLWFLVNGFPSFARRAPVIHRPPPRWPD